MDAGFSAKDAARSKFKSSARHKPTGPGGRGFAARGAGRSGRGGEGGGASRSPSASPPRARGSATLDDAAGGNAWRYTEEAEAEEAFASAAAAAAAAGEPPPPRSGGADLAELLERAAQSTFLGRGGASSAFAPGWGDPGDGDGLATGGVGGGAASLAALLDWKAQHVAAALAPLPLHALLGLSRRHTADCEEQFSFDVAAALAASAPAPAAAAHAVPAAAPPAPPPPPPRAQAPAAAALVPAAAVVAPSGGGDDDDDDAFLDEMLGR